LENDKINVLSINDELAQEILDFYRKAIIKHPYVNPLHVFARAFLWNGVKIILVKEIGYVMAVKNLYYKIFSYYTFFHPPIVSDIVDLNHFYSITSRFKSSFTSLDAVHFYINDEYALKVYQKIMIFMALIKKNSLMS
jgi:hypothetical protein